MEARKFFFCSLPGHFFIYCNLFYSCNKAIVNIVVSSIPKIEFSSSNSFVVSCLPDLCCVSISSSCANTFCSHWPVAWLCINCNLTKSMHCYITSNSKRSHSFNDYFYCFTSLWDDRTFKSHSNAQTTPS